MMRGTKLGPQGIDQYICIEHNLIHRRLFAPPRSLSIGMESSQVQGISTVSGNSPQAAKSDTTACPSNGLDGAWENRRYGTQYATRQRPLGDSLSVTFTFQRIVPF